MSTTRQPKVYLWGAKPAASSCFMLLVVILLCSGVCVADGFDTAQLLRPNVAVLEMTSNDRTWYAFGIITGEANGNLGVATARHAIMCDSPPGCEVAIHVRLFEQLDRTIATLVCSDAALDLALLSVPKPDGFTWEFFCVDSREPEPETPVWPFGTATSWELPLRSTPSYIRSFDAAHTWLEVVEADIVPGASGAPIVSERGIVGMIQTDDRTRARVLWIDVIGRAVVEMGGPWELRSTGSLDDRVDMASASYGGELVDVCLTSASAIGTDGGDLVIAASTTSYGAGGYDILLFRVDRSGVIRWQKAIGGSGYDDARAICSLQNGGFAVCGTTESFGDGSKDVFVVCVDDDGSVLWEKSYGGPGEDEGMAIAGTQDGGLVIAANTTSFGEGQTDTWIIRTDLQGEVEWQWTYGSDDEDYVDCIERVDDGGFIVATHRIVESRSTLPDMWYAYALRLDREGNTVWYRRYWSDKVGMERHEINSIEEVTAGGFVMVGTATKSTRPDADIWVMHTDSFGRPQWSLMYGGSESEYGYSAIATEDGDLTIAGYTHSFGVGELDLWLLRLTSSGMTRWTRTYGSLADDRTPTIVSDWEGASTLVASTQSVGAGDWDILVLRVDSDGEPVVSCDHLLLFSEGPVIQPAEMAYEETTQVSRSHISTYVAARSTSSLHLDTSLAISDLCD